MIGRVLKIAPGIAGMPRLEAAARVLNRLTAPRPGGGKRVVKLGQYEEGITARTRTLCPEHIPHADHPGAAYQQMVLSFLEGMERIEQGAEWLAGMGGAEIRMDEVLGLFQEREVPEYRTGLANCVLFEGMMQELSEGTLLRMAWFLRDAAQNLPQETLTSLKGVDELMARGRVRLSSPLAAQALAGPNGERVRITGIELATGQGINRFGLAWHQLVFVWDGRGGRRSFSNFSLARAGQGGSYAVNNISYNPARGDFMLALASWERVKTHFQYYPLHELAPVQVTTAKDPKITKA